MFQSDLPSEVDFPLTHRLLRDMAGEFPTFEIRRKRTSRLQRTLHWFLFIVTLGGQKTYITEYHTVLFGKLWVPDTWDSMTDAERTILLRHERVHLRQRARWGDLRMGFQYLFVFFPIGLAWGRARIEWEAYEETIAATFEILGEVEARALRERLVQRFTGPDYGWMWPFPETIRAWFDECLTRVMRRLASPPT